MNIAIVGSRTFPQLKLVEWFIRDLPLGVRIISGGAIGVDSAAVEYARQRGLETEVCLPDLNGCKERYEFTRRYYARNEKIVTEADLVVAFTEKDKGGTWDTIKRAHKIGKPFKVIKPSLLFPGEDTDASEPEPGADKRGRQRRHTGNSAGTAQGARAVSDSPRVAWQLCLAPQVLYRKRRMGGDYRGQGQSDQRRWPKRCCPRSANSLRTIGGLAAYMRSQCRRVASAIWTSHTLWTLLRKLAPAKSARNL